MQCPFCKSSETKVVDKRETPDNEAIRRRRECEKCEKRWTTYERIEMAPLVIIKKDGTTQSFDRIKLYNGILRACEKRPVSVEQIEEMTADIEREMRDEGITPIKSSKIGEKVIKRLKKLDKVAYIRFASVYREFTDLESFQEELNKLLKK